MNVNTCWMREWGVGRGRRKVERERGRESKRGKGRGRERGGKKGSELAELAGIERIKLA